MRIGMIAPPWIPVPPTGYGGTESVVDYLARGLCERGHDVRLFTVGESTCPVPRLHLYSQAVQPIGAVVPEVAHVLAAYDALADVDVVHDHTLVGPLIAAARGDCPPLVTTSHGPPTPENRRIFEQTSRHATVVAISHAQARAGVPATAVIHHGVDTNLYRSGPGRGGYLLFIGRMCADKGVHRAVRVARRAGCRLIVVAKMREAAERSYFENEVRPLLTPLVEVLIESSLPQRVELLRHADALLNPISWPEPFGLVMAESLACGTPVLALPGGAAPEIVDHGHTGFLCAGEDDMVEAIDHVADLDRNRCRAAAVSRFSLERMTGDYERLFHAVARPLGGNATARVGRPASRRGTPSRATARVRMRG
jgi:glycosyltransferase involved in cell wall biosynthesis